MSAGDPSDSGPPPRWLAFVRRLLPRRWREEIEGDLVETWATRPRGARHSAARRFWIDVWSVAISARLGRSRRSWRTAIAAAIAELATDLRFTGRLVGRQPAFSALAILTLAFGIAASTAIFTVADRALIRPLPYPAPDQLVHVDRLAVVLRREAAGVSILPREVKTAAGFRAIGFYEPGGLEFDRGGDPVRLRAAAADSGFFATLGARPLLGRVFDAADDRGVRVAILSAEAWRRYFAEDTSIVGRSIRLSRQSFTIVGVMPADVALPDRAEVWIPPGVDARMSGAGQRGGVIGRLDAGVSIANATERLATLKYAAFGERQAGPPPSMSPLRDHLVAGARPTLLFLVGLVSLLLAATCASVASLVFSRLTNRAREFGVRSALGASRGRIARQLLVETLTLGSAGAAVGLIAGLWIVRVALTTSPIPGVVLDGVDARALSVGLGVSILTCAFCSMTALMSLHTGRWSVGRAAGTTRGAWPRMVPGLLVAQIAVATILLAATATALVAIDRFARVDYGIRNLSAFTFKVTLPAAAYPDSAAVGRFAADLLDRLASLPGVGFVGMTDHLPGSDATKDLVHLALAGGGPETRDGHGTLLVATPDYFRAMGVPLLAGRFFEPSDTTRPVVMLNETAARVLDTDVSRLVGRRLVRPDAEIVGIVGNLRLDAGQGLPEPIEAMRQAHIFRPLAQAPPRGTLSVAMDGAAGIDVASMVRASLRDLDPDLALYDSSRAGDLPAAESAAERLRLTLSILFAVVVLGLASMGLYGVLSQIVGRRTREIGTRLALGEHPRHVRATVVWTAARLACAGLLAGSVAAVVLWRVAAASIPDLDRPDPRVLVAEALVLICVACLAGWIPARRASAIDPAAALRAE